MPIDIPNLFIVGAAKCGTTLIHEVLNCHGNINMSYPKEPHYMLREYFEGSIFEGPGDRERISNYILDENYFKLFDSNFKFNGESSPGYFSEFSIAIPMIKQHIDEPKIIICLRNPIERAFSSYKYKKVKRLENVSFHDLVDNHKKYEQLRRNWSFGFNHIEDSFYYKRVKAFKESFKDVEVIFLEEIVTKPEKVCSQIEHFLLLKEGSLNPKQFKNPVNNNVILPKGLVSNWAAEIYKLNKRFIPRKLKNSAKLLFAKKDKADPKSKIALRHLLNDDVDQLSRYVNIDLFKLWHL